MAKDSSNLLLEAFCYLEAFKLKRLESRIFRELELGIVVSEVDKSLLQKLCPEGRFEVIENGVDVSKFRPNPEKADPNTLLWVGGFDHFPNKQGIYWFLDSVFPLIKRGLPEIELQLIGGGVPDKLKRLASADFSIKLLGYVDDPIPYIQRATVFIVPILSGSGTRLKLLEAMAVGKAIVTTNIGCEGIEGADDKHFLITDTPEQFSAAITKLLNDKKLRLFISNNARQIAEKKYDWKILLERLDSVYKELLMHES